VLAIAQEPGYARGAADERKKRRALLADLVRATVPALPGGARTAANAPDAGDDKVWVHNTPLPEATSDATFDTLMRFADVAAKVDEIIQLCTWLGECLLPLAKSAPPQGWPAAKWAAETLQPWEGGWYVQVNGDGEEDYVWVAARPPGELVLGIGIPQTGAKVGDPAQATGGVGWC
jgi:hypothetical protein